MVAALYPDVLVETSTTVMPGKKEIKFLGKNEKKILIVTDHAGTVFLPDDELQFLTTVLSACKLQIDDVAIINWQQVEPKHYTSIGEEISNKQILLFNVSPAEFGLSVNFPHFQVQQVDQRTYLFAPSLREVEKNVETKKLLWIALKRFFAI